MSLNPLQDRRWPEKCICSLCDCGEHSCSTFKVPTSTDANQKREEAKYINSNNNRCAKEDLSKRTSIISRSKIEGANKKMLSTDETRSETGSSPAIDCSCLNGERYLASPASRQTPRSYDEIDTDKGEPAELLHVFVTRPEIASKPRDNIIFEGDMDLRTTFETSYEALAKMRLNHWKRHQEQQNRHQRTKSAISRVDEGIVSTQVNGTETAKSVGHMGRVSGEQARKDTSSKQRSTEEIYGGKAEGNDRRKQTGMSEQRVAVDHRRPSKKVDNSVAAKSNRSKNERVRHSIEPSRAESAVQTEFLAQVIAEANEQEASTKTTPTPYDRQFTSRDYIDPDLSPIIVYDANLNRLERVGLRKRSKYRPSTSLRSGSKGLFGDQEEVSWEDRPTYGAMPKGRGEQQPSAAGHWSGSGGGGSSRQDRYMEASAVTAGTSARQQPGYDSLTEGALSARNLGHTNQANYLTFSSGNLPLDSKRRVQDNVNMIDHIKEQNIVETRAEIHPKQSYDKSREHARELTRSTQTPSERRDVLDEMENLRLTQQEEAAAVEELSRITQQGRESDLHQSDAQERASTADENSKTYLDSCQSKLQRTCQNQSFYLFENEYPQGKADHGGYPITGVHKSPQPRIHNNLFRESPDFILTTESGTDNSSPSENEVRQSGKANDVLDSTLRKDDYTTDETVDHQTKDCRVYKLQDDYQFIGSKSGHNYFVEKHDELKE